MYCSCGCNKEMLRHQHELRLYFQCVACGRVHWTNDYVKSQRKSKESRLFGPDVSEATAS